MRDVNAPRLTGGALYLIVQCCALAVPPDVWHVRESASSNQLNAVAYGNTRFVAAGAAGTILTSTNGADWTSRAAPAAVTFYSAAASWRYALGGELSALVVRSIDGVQWTNILSAATGLERVHGLIDFGTYLAVGRGPQSGTSYISFSGSGTTWLPRSVPTTNTLFAVAPPFPPGGQWLGAGQLVAVGDRGTILTSSNGVDWIARESDTTVPLRAVVHHHGRIIVGGDSGIVLTSSDGISWSFAAPTSFNIRGLASSGRVVVAVGEHLNAGRLHVSSDGLTWPGESIQFPTPLNAVAFGSNTFVAVGDHGFIVESEHVSRCDVNEWTKPASGYWEEAFWSCGRLPVPAEPSLAFRNPGWKALAIGQNTTANFSDSLLINALTIEAPEHSFNTLLLNYAGTNVPLRVQQLTLGTNASLVSYYSALNAGRLELKSPAVFSENSLLHADDVWVDSHLTVSNSVASIGRLLLFQNSIVDLIESAGQLGLVVMEADSTLKIDGNVGIYELHVQSDKPGFSPPRTPSGGTATVIQENGYLGSWNMVLGRPGLWRKGVFVLKNGIHQTVHIAVLNGTIRQSGGTNNAGDLRLPTEGVNCSGDYILTGGTLYSRSVSLGAAKPINPPSPGAFFQSGGVHSNGSMIVSGYERWEKQVGIVGIDRSGSYSHQGGELISGQLRIRGGGFSQSAGRSRIQELSIEGFGRFTLSAGEVITSNTTVSAYKVCTTPFTPPQTCFFSSFTQQGGTHIVENVLNVSSEAVYNLRGGALVASNILVSSSAELNCENGSISNSGTFTLYGGRLRAGPANYDLGRLNIFLAGSALTTLQGGGFLRFRDSSDVPWSGNLQIHGWRPKEIAGGSHQIFFGTNSHGLSANQLSRIYFVNPTGWSPGSYPARILETGEVVPAVPPNLAMVRDSAGLILSWPGEYDLLTATNVLGPYFKLPSALSPMTNPFTGPEQYFRLSLPSPPSAQ
jgi:hypothetical protein